MRAFAFTGSAFATLCSGGRARTGLDVVLFFWEIRLGELELTLDVGWEGEEHAALGRRTGVVSACTDGTGRRATGARSGRNGIEVTTDRGGRGRCLGEHGGEVLDPEAKFLGSDALRLAAIRVIEDTEDAAGEKLCYLAGHACEALHKKGDGFGPEEFKWGTGTSSRVRPRIMVI
jgi:hypothetical protein